MLKTDEVTGKKYFHGRNNKDNMRSMQVGEKVYFKNRNKRLTYDVTASQLRKAGEGEWSVYMTGYDVEGCVVRIK